MDEEEFWKSTPYLTRLRCDAAAERDLNQYRHEVFVSWNTAFYTRTKKPHSLKVAMDRVGSLTPKKTVRQSPKEMLRTVELIVAQFGGRDKRKKPTKGH